LLHAKTILTLDDDAGPQELDQCAGRVLLREAGALRDTHGARLSERDRRKHAQSALVGELAENT
jgi:hypothetical protein